MSRARSALAALALAATLALPRPAAAQEWTPVQQWTGNGSRTTESFEVTGAEWRVTWQVAPSHAARFPRYTEQSVSVTVYDLDGRAQAITWSQAAAEPQWNVFHLPPGRYYLRVSAGLGGAWTVTREDPA
jgi:hypothetical protein